MSFTINQEIPQSFSKPTETLKQSSGRVQQVQNKSKLQKKKIISKAQKTQQKAERVNIGQWNYTQNFLYASFLQANLAQLESQLKRRQTKIFVRMEKLICTRTADQCRSHHQKCMKKYGSAEQVVKSLLLNRVESQKNSIKSIRLLNSNYGPLSYNFLSNNYNILPFPTDESRNSYIGQKTCHCHQAKGIRNSEQNLNEKMLAFINEKSDDDKNLPKTCIQDQKQINQEQIAKNIFCQTYKNFSRGVQDSKNIPMTAQDQFQGKNQTNTKNLAIQFGAKGKNSFQSFIQKQNVSEKIKLTLNVEGIGHWSLNY